jgi:hypothetical protein
MPYKGKGTQVDIEKVTEKRGFGHYEKVTQIDTLPVGTGGQNGDTHERTKSGNAGNRKYAIRVLSMPLVKTATMVRDGKTVVFKAEKKPRPKNRLDHATPASLPAGCGSTGCSTRPMSGRWRALRRARIPVPSKSSSFIAITAQQEQGRFSNRQGLRQSFGNAYQRLMESSLTEEEKAGLSAKRALLNPVELHYHLNQAFNNLLAVHKANLTFSKGPTQRVSVTF